MQRGRKKNTIWTIYKSSHAAVRFWRTYILPFVLLVSSFNVKLFEGSAIGSICQHRCWKQECKLTQNTRYTNKNNRWLVKTVTLKCSLFLCLFKPGRSLGNGHVSWCSCDVIGICEGRLACSRGNSNNTHNQYISWLQLTKNQLFSFPDWITIVCWLSRCFCFVVASLSQDQNRRAQHEWEMHSPTSATSKTSLRQLTSHATPFDRLSFVPAWSHILLRKCWFSKSLQQRQCAKPVVLSLVCDSVGGAVNNGC